MNNNNWTGNNAHDAKLEFVNARAALLAANLDPQSVAASCLTQSYLRLEVQANITQNTYALNVLANIQNNGVAVRTTEVRLQLQDAFYASGVTVSVAKPASLTSTAINPISYPNTVVFATAGAAAALYTLYNGYMSININNDVVMTRYPLMNFLDVPLTQATGATNSPQDAFSGSNRQALQPNPVFIGQNNSVVTLHLPSALAVVETTQLIIVEFFGVLAQNVSSLVSR